MSKPISKLSIRLAKISSIAHHEPLPVAAMTEELTMSTRTIRLPNAKHERLKGLARSKRVSVSKLFEE